MGFPNDILSQIKSDLEEEQNRLTGQIEELKKQDPFADPGRTIDNAASDGEASEESDHDRVAALIDELTKKRDGIAAAIVRVTDGTYGYCVSCQAMIDTDRLSILPTATLCRSCEEKKKRR